jgi:hypothetical protein
LSFVENLDGEILDQVIAANARFKDEQSYNKSEVQRLQNTIDSLIYYDDYVGPTNLDELNAQILSLSVLRDQWISYNSAMDATQSMQTELTDLENKLDQFGGKPGYDNLQSKLDMLKSKFTELSAVINNKQKELTAIRTKDAETTAIIQSNGVCPYTKDTCRSMIAKIEDLRNESVKYKAIADK